MMELVYDIASGANFKFNTAFDGIQVRFAPAAFSVMGQHLAMQGCRLLRQLCMLGASLTMTTDDSVRFSHFPDSDAFPFFSIPLL